MRKFIGFIVVIGIILLLAGGAIVAHAVMNDKFKVASYENKEVLLEEDFENIDIKICISDVTFTYNDENKIIINYDEVEGYTQTFNVNDNTLLIKEEDNLKWYQRIHFFNFVSPKMTISLPKKAYSNLDMETHTGDTTIDGFDFNNLKYVGHTGNFKYLNATSNSFNVTVSTGNLYIENVNVTTDVICNSSTGDIKVNNLNAVNATFKASTGNIKLNNMIASNTLYCKASTGNILFERCDGKTIEAHASTGSIKGTILTNKTFYTESSTGSVNVPHTTGEACTLTTSTGNINIKIVE